MRKTRPVEERFWEKVRKSRTCWEWTGAVGKHGYGNFYLLGKWVRAHRFSYELLVGPIPEGLVLDHLCRNRRCINPKHLEPVTHSENNRRVPTELRRRRPKSCINGHELTGDNVYVQPKTGYRYCRTCQRARDAAYKARKLAVAGAA